MLTRNRVNAFNKTMQAHTKRAKTLLKCIRRMMKLHDYTKKIINNFAEKTIFILL